MTTFMLRVGKLACAAALRIWGAQSAPVANVAAVPLRIERRVSRVIAFLPLVVRIIGKGAGTALSAGAGAGGPMVLCYPQARVSPTPAEVTRLRFSWILSHGSGGLFCRRGGRLVDQPDAGADQHH